MDGACGTYGGRGKVHTGFWMGGLRERDHFENLHLGRMLKVDLQEIGWEAWTIPPSTFHLNITVDCVMSSYLENLM
jgi:hypothetical protein